MHQSGSHIPDDSEWLDESDFVDEEFWESSRAPSSGIIFVVLGIVGGLGVLGVIGVAVLIFVAREDSHRASVDREIEIRFGDDFPEFPEPMFDPPDVQPNWPKGFDEHVGPGADPHRVHEDLRKEMDRVRREMDRRRDEVMRRHRERMDEMRRQHEEIMRRGTTI